MKISDKTFKWALFLLITFFVFGVMTSLYLQTDKALAKVPEKLIRLHVVANSDSPEDQALKLKIRDAVIKTMSPKFENLENINDVKKVINENIPAIESIAKSVMVQEGRIYDVKASLAMTEFPTKVYGNLTLPAGEYQALNIKIGSAQGKNWWCVMFPPLCFVDVAHGVVPEETMDGLKTSLTEQEYELLVAEEKEADAPVRMKFKVFEIAKSMSQKFARLAGVDE